MRRTGLVTRDSSHVVTNTRGSEHQVSTAPHTSTPSTVLGVVEELEVVVRWWWWGGERAALRIVVSSNSATGDCHYSSQSWASLQSDMKQHSVPPSLLS